MVFKHNMLPCDHTNSFQLAFQHTRQLDCGGQFAFSSQRHIPEKLLFPDGAGPGGNLKFEKMDDIASDCGSRCALPDTSNLVMDSNCDTMKLENNIKRPFDDDDNSQVASKRTKQTDAISSTCVDSFAAFTADDKLNSRRADVIPEDANDSYGRRYRFPWFTCSVSGEDTRLESPVGVSFYPGYYEDYWRPTRHACGEEYDSPVFNYPPRKPVAIGPDHQADLPILRYRSFPSCRQGDIPDASALNGHSLTDEDNCGKWTGHCVVPMPDSSSLVEPFGRVKTDCHCLDEGSIRCVRRHVMEARDELRSSLGSERFEELGLQDMGEHVASGWTEEEELLFNDVVIANPPSSGKNFWDNLPLAFPTKSSKELVSYYFNVFMLRKRAEQNRCDSVNVDSDNDEWQYSDEGEFEVTEDDEEDDSGVESPADAAAARNRVRINGDDIHEAGEDYSEEDEYDISDGSNGDGKPKFGPHVQRVCISSHDYTGEDQDVHDDSCTSYEGQHDGVQTLDGGANSLDGLRHSLGEEADHRDTHTDYRNGDMGGMTDHDFVIGHYDPKPWEIGYFHGTDKDLDLLPTCNVIEEVFGNESWENSRDGHGVS